MAWTSNGTYSFESQALTRTAPTTDATEGQALKDLSVIVVVLSAEVTRTLSGAGTLRCYIYDSVIARWVNHPGADIPIATSGKRDFSYGPFAVPGPRNSRIMWIADGVTVSGGTTVVVHQLGHAPGVIYG